MRRLTTAALLLASLGTAQAGPDITGLWLTDDGEAGIDIQACGPALCGTLAWLPTPTDGSGQALRDVNNPDATQRAKLLCGLAILGDARPDGSGWEHGWIYDPDEGKRYDLALARRDDGQLAVTGFVGLKALGRTVLWQRPQAPLPRCDAPAAKSRP